MIWKSTLWLPCAAVLGARATGAEPLPQASSAPPTSGTIGQSLVTATPTVGEIDHTLRILA